MKPGKETKLVILMTDEGQCSRVFIVSDGACVCDINTIENGLLLLLGVYFLLNLNYPKQYAQVLGFFQVTCLKQEFPVSQRSTAFTKLKESLQL